MTKRKRTILLGKGTLAIQAAAWLQASDLYELTLIVPDMPEPNWTDSLSTWASTQGIDQIPTGRHEDIPGLKEDGFQIDLVLSIFYGRIFPAWFINKCDRIINLHNSPLPTYRGIAPVNWALKNGEILHGVTIHEINPGIDNGPIIGQATYSIYPETDEVIDVYNRGLAFGWELFKAVMPRLDDIAPRPQDESLATYYSSDDAVLLEERRNFTRAESQ